MLRFFSIASHIHPVRTEHFNETDNTNYTNYTAYMDYTDYTDHGELEVKPDTVSVRRALDISHHAFI